MSDFIKNLGKGILHPDDSKRYDKFKLRAMRELKSGVIDTILSDKAELTHELDGKAPKASYIELRADSLMKKHFELSDLKYSFLDHIPFVSRLESITREIYDEEIIEVEDYPMEIGDWTGFIKNKIPYDQGYIRDIYGTKSVHKSMYNSFERILLNAPYKLPNNYLNKSS